MQRNITNDSDTIEIFENRGYTSYNHGNNENNQSVNDEQETSKELTREGRDSFAESDALFKACLHNIENDEAATKEKASKAKKVMSLFNKLIHKNKDEKEARTEKKNFLSSIIRRGKGK